MCVSDVHVPWDDVPWHAREVRGHFLGVSSLLPPCRSLAHPISSLANGPSAQWVILPATKGNLVKL